MLLARQSRPDKLHRASPMSLTYGGDIIRAWGIIGLYELPRTPERRSSLCFIAPPRPYTNRDGVEPHLALYHAPNCYVYC